ncbi:VrrA/YqfQ family protein [Gracilibacillus halophilus]|nr:VrrA/YqfQ family protein [Gracilibacillus halophilus]
MFRPPHQPPNMFPQQPFQNQGFFSGLPSRGPIPGQGPSGLQGILQRLFSSSSSTPGFMPPGSGVTSSGGNIMNTLNNVQQALKVAQQATPLIKEYGPMVKNAPKLIQMMKALNEINNEEDDENAIADSDDGKEKVNINESDEELDTILDDIDEQVNEDELKEIKPKKENGQSKPKLFI